MIYKLRNFLFYLVKHNMIYHFLAGFGGYYILKYHLSWWLLPDILIVGGGIGWEIFWKKRINEYISIGDIIAVIIGYIGAKLAYTRQPLYMLIGFGMLAIASWILYYTWTRK